MRCGGGTNHRQRLDDGILIKDNHKRLAGGVAAGGDARDAGSRGGLPVEVEVETLDELDEALAAGVPRILLDNFTTYDIREAVQARRRPRRDRDLRRRDARADSGARHDRRAVRLGRRAHAFGARRGSQLRARAGGMIPEEFAAALAALRERRPDARLDVRWHASVPSTMDVAAALAHDGAAHGVVVVADEQTAGRGRAARRGRRRRAPGCISRSSRGLASAVELDCRC